jgi:hypothetical protein
VRINQHLQSYRIPLHYIRCCCWTNVAHLAKVLCGFTIQDVAVIRGATVLSVCNADRLTQHCIRYPGQLSVV